jgi:hypothetical protein
MLNNFLVLAVRTPAETKRQQLGSLIQQQRQPGTGISAQKALISNSDAIEPK